MRPFKCISALTILFGFGSRQRSIFSALVVSLSLFYSAFSYADGYYWTNRVVSGTFSSAAEACAAFSGFVVWSSTETSAVCTKPGTNAGSSIQVDRHIDNCKSPTKYDYISGNCITPPPTEPDNKCAALKDTAIPSFKFKSTSDAPTGTISKNGCAIKLGTGICVTRTAPLYDCTFSGTVTGDQLAVQDGTSTADCTGDQCHEGEPQKETKEDPCSAIPTGSGFTCTSSKSEDNPGKSQCGTANGAYVCVDNPKPTSSASTTKTQQTSTSNSDGSTTTKTTNTTTTTVCKGIGNCTTGTTTTVVTGGTNSNGTTKPNSSTCSGPECGGGTVKPGNGTGSGNSGEGEGEEGDDEQDTVSGDMSCDAVVACSGDVIQCAILRQDQQSRCADKDFRDLSDKKVADAKSSLESEFAGSDYKELKPDAQHTFDVSNMLDTSGFLGSTCPALPTITGSYGQFAVNIDFNLSSFCTMLTVLGYIAVFFALRRAAQIIGEGVA